jgi:hypothetical protein
VEGGAEVKTPRLSSDAIVDIAGAIGIVMDRPSDLSTQVTNLEVACLVAEVIAARALTLTAEDVEALRELRNFTDRAWHRSGPSHAAIAVLDRIIAAHKEQG